MKQEPDETQINNINNDLDDEKDPKETIIENTKEEKKTDKLSFDVEKLQHLIKTTVEEVEKYETKLENNEMVYFYGNAGAGKSTIINYLLGNELEKYYPEDEKNLTTKKKHVDDQNNTNTQSDSDSDDFTCGVQSKQKEKIFRIRLKEQHTIVPRISPNPIQSETIYPCPYFPKNHHQLGYCDTAGFSDTKGIENIVCTYIGNNLIIQKSEKLKAICFVTYKSALETRRGEPFLNSVISTISNLIKETEDCNPLDSIFIVLNNKKQVENKELEQKVFTLLNGFRKAFKESKQNEQQNEQKYESYIRILKKILKDASKKETKRILAIDPLDDGKSREAFLDRISTSPIIPKTNLKKLASKQGEEKVRYLQKEMLQETNPILDNILKTENKIYETIKKKSELAIKITKNFKEKETFQKTINNLESQSKKAKDERQKLTEEITNNKKDQKEIEKEIDNLGLEKILVNDNETQQLLSQHNFTINNHKEIRSSIENEQNEIKTEIKNIKQSIKFTNDKIGELTLQTDKETKQIQELKKAKDTLLENTTQDRIIQLAKEDKNWFDNYKEWLDSISDYWAKTKLEQKIFDSLRNNIYNALKKCNPDFRILSKHTGGITSVHFNSEGTLLASASKDDMTINIWNTSNWRCIKTLAAHLDDVHSVHFTPDGTLLASASKDKTIKIWDTSNWRCIKTLEAHLDDVHSVHFNSKGTLLASGSEDRTIRVWDTFTWDCKKVLTVDSKRVYSVHFNPSSTLLALGSWDNKVEVWDTRSWKRKEVLYHGRRVYAVNFNPSGTLLASGSYSNYIKIWDTNTWDCTTTFEAHTWGVNSVHFNSKGTLLASSASGSLDKTVKIWDTSNWNCIKTLQGHAGYVHSVHFNQSGTLLASGSEDSTIKVWDVKNMLDSEKSNYSLLDQDKFKFQTDKHLARIKEIIKYYYDTKTQELTESEAQKVIKGLKEDIESLKENLSTKEDERINLQKQINEINSKINATDTKKLEKIEEKIKNKQTNHKVQQKLAQQIQKKKEVDSIIEQLEQSKIQKKEDLDKFSNQLSQAQTKHEYLLKEIGRIESNHEDISRDLKTEENDLVAYQGMLERKQPSIELVLKIEKIVPMGLIALSFIKKYMQCKVNNKHM